MKSKVIFNITRLGKVLVIWKYRHYQNVKSVSVISFLIILNISFHYLQTTLQALPRKSI